MNDLRHIQSSHCEKLTCGESGPSLSLADFRTYSIRVSAAELWYGSRLTRSSVADYIPIVCEDGSVSAVPVWTPALLQ